MNAINLGIPSKEKKLTLKRETHMKDRRHERCLELKQFSRALGLEQGVSRQPGALGARSRPKQAVEGCKTQPGQLGSG